MYPPCFDYERPMPMIGDLVNNALTFGCTMMLLAAFPTMLGIPMIWATPDTTRDA
jgi:hypothetical protein